LDPGTKEWTLARVDLDSGRTSPIRVIPFAFTGVGGGDQIGYSFTAGLGFIWVSTDGGVLQVNPSTGATLNAWTDHSGPTQIACGRVWLIGGEDIGGLLAIDPADGTTVKYPALGYELLENDQGCWQWVAPAELSRVFPARTADVPMPEYRLQSAGRSLWTWPSQYLQRFDPLLGRPIGPAWTIDSQDLQHPPGTDVPGLLIAAAGSLWMVNGYEVVRFDVAAGT
jgi:hypothetical protein